MIPTTDPLPWDRIIPLDTPLDLPSFPVDALCSPLDKMTIDISDSVNIEPDAPAVASLGFASIAALGNYRYQVGEHYEIPALWLCECLASGERKSPVVAQLSGPIHDWEREELERLAPQLRELREKRAIQEARLKDLRSKAAKEQDPTEHHNLSQQVIELSQQLTEVPTFPRLIVQDVTPEAIPMALAESQGRLALISAEGGFFNTVSGRYSGIPNIDAINQAYSGETIHVDRVGRERLAVPNPQLTIILAVQPVVLRELKGAVFLRRSGTLPRFLFSIAGSRVGSRLYRDRSKEPGVILASNQLCARYEQVLRGALGSISLDGAQPLKVIRLHPEAFEFWIQFHNEIEFQLREGARLHHIQDWGNKLPGQVVRIAGAMHVIEHAHANPADLPISAETMERATWIGEYFVEHALAAFELMAADPAMELALRVIRWIRRHQRESFSTAEVRDHIRESSEEIEAALAVLLDRHYIRALPPPEHKGRGRKPSPRWEVNPAVFSPEPTPINSLNSVYCQDEGNCPNSPNLSGRNGEENESASDPLGDPPDADDGGTTLSQDGTELTEEEIDAAIPDWVPEAG